MNGEFFYYAFQVCNGFYYFSGRIGFISYSVWESQKLAMQDPQKRFLILIPAHNEEAVIGSLVKNLMKLDYPKELYDVAVIADNCTDRTAEISRSLGAKVIEHTSKPGELKVKPYGIKYALEVIGDDLTKI